MATRAEKKDALRSALITAAEARMTTGGLSGLKARDVTADAGCALGALYNAFDGLDDLILHVNARTLDRMSMALAEAREGLDPAPALHALALAYGRFAAANRPLWDALFDHNIAEGEETPDWFKAHQRSLLAHIVTPLAALQPTLDTDSLHLRARTYFSAIHGVVSISLQGRFVGLPGDSLDAEITRLVGYIITGSLAGPAA